MGQAAYGANETIGPHAQALVRPGQGPPKSGSIMRRAVIAKPSARSPLKLRHRDRLHSPRKESEREGGWQPRPNAQHWAGVCAWADETERASDTGILQAIVTTLLTISMSTGLNLPRPRPSLSGTAEPARGADPTSVAR
jgi:hypothetical protein